MLPVLYFSILFLNAYMFIRKKDSKILQIITIIFIILFVAGIRYNGSVIGYDQRNYMIHYEDPSTINILEFGYMAINYLGRFLGLSYEQFYMLLASCIVIANFLSVRRLNCNIHFFVIIYMLGAILIPTSQLRNACAFAIFFSLFPFYKKNGEFNYIKVCLGILLAATFHTTFILFLIYPLAAKLSKKVLHWGFVAIVATGLLLVLTGGMRLVSGALVELVTMLGPAFSKYIKYFADPTRLSPLYSIAVLIMTIFSLFYWKKNCVDVEGEVKTVALQSNADGMLRVALTTACFVPLILLNATNYRFFRDISLIAMAHLGININSPACKQRDRLILLSCVLALSAGGFVFDIVIKGYLTSYLENFFINAILG